MSHSNKTRVNISPPAKVIDYLDKMVRLGLYGQTRSEVALRLMCEGIERRIVDGTLQRVEIMVQSS